MSDTATILPFRPRALPRDIDEMALARLGRACDEITAARLAVDIETYNITHATGRLSPSGSIVDGRALAGAARLILALVDLRGNPEGDHVLTQAVRRWLDERKGGTGPMKPKLHSTEDFMRATAQALDEVLNGKGSPKENGFVLLVFPLAGPEGNRTNYVSNADRADIVAALKEIVARFEGQAQARGNA